MIFAKLLSRVDPNATTGAGFDGVVVRPGATVELASLWPSVEFPKTPILLEYAGRIRVRGCGRERDTLESVYILWRFNVELLRWEEIARSQSAAWEWAIDLRPVAVRALNENAVEVLPCLDTIAGAIAEFIELQLRPLEAADRRQVLVSILHDRCAGELVAQMQPGAKLLR